MGGLTMRTPSGMVAENSRVCLSIEIRTFFFVSWEPDAPRDDSSLRQECNDFLQGFAEASIK